jgi:hypothetical protein
MEGPDGCGKTNIGQALSKYFGIPYFKVETEHENWRAGKFKEALEFDQTYISQFLQQTGFSCIIDRAYPSEFVYSGVYNRETNFDVLSEVDKRFSKMDAIIVLCRRDDYSNVKDELVETNMLGKLNEEYKLFKEWTLCNVIDIKVDMFNDDIEEQLPAIRKAVIKIKDYTKKPVKLRV